MNASTNASTNVGPAPTLRHAREIIRDEMAMHLPIVQALVDGPLTVPAIADRMGRPRDEVMVWVMGMRRYGLLAESGDADDDGYFAYRVTDRGLRNGGRS